MSTFPAAVDEHEQRVSREKQDEPADQRYKWIVDHPDESQEWRP
jgi:hypothetical protein